MTGRPNRDYRLEKFPKARTGQTPYKYRRPFWLPASNFYVLAAAATITFFFIVWAILNDDGDATPWIPSGIAAGFVLGGAVFLREVVLRKAREQFLLTQKQLDANLKSVSPQSTGNEISHKLTVEKNAAIIKEIRRKSENARVLGKFSDGHLEVFELCGEYLRFNKQQLETVGIGSPRLAALRRGRETVEGLHHFHLLAWAQNETILLTRESKVRVTIEKKIESAQRALLILDSALSFYPNDEQLLESEKIIKEFIISVKVSHSIEQAERAAFKGNYKRAISCYKDALYFIARESVQGQEVNLIVGQIKGEIEKLRDTSKAENKKILPD